MSKLLRMPALARFSVPQYEQTMAEAIAHQTSDAIFVTAPDGIVTYWNPAAEQIFGFSAQEIEGRHLHDLIHHHHADGRPYARDECPMETLRRAGTVVREHDAVLFHRNGSQILASISTTPLEVDGDAAGVLLTVRDMTKSRQAEQAAREGDSQIRRLVAADVVGILIVSGDRLLEANDFFLHSLGYTREEFERGGLTVADFSAAEFLALNEERRGTLIATGSCAAFETECIRKDGESVPMLMGGVACEYRSELCMIGFAVDLTERRNRERQVRQAHRLETIGQLAGAIAHDFNNLLTIILGNSEQMLDVLTPEDPLRTMATEISESALHAAELTRELVMFGRERPPRREKINLADLVSHVEKLLRRLIGDHIRIAVSYSQEPLSIEADPTQMEQVVLNLALNARDAMPDGGTMWIETSRVVAEDELSAMCLGAPPGEYVQITLSDTGIGMTPEVRERCFEPFFTTKEEGKGSGLGLSTVHGIVKRSGGVITVHSARGIGTTFRILFPLAEKHMTRADDKTEAAHGAGTILVVDDEDKIRSYIVSVLTGNGYRVLEAANGAAALKLARGFKGVIDLLLTDFAMPGFDGREMARRLDRKREGLRVLMMSGYAEPEVLTRRRNLAYIQKPFTRRELLMRIQEILETPRLPDEPVPYPPASVNIPVAPGSENVLVADDAPALNHRVRKRN